MLLKKIDVWKRWREKKKYISYSAKNYLGSNLEDSKNVDQNLKYLTFEIKAYKVDVPQVEHS